MVDEVRLAKYMKKSSMNVLAELDALATELEAFDPRLALAIDKVADALDKTVKLVAPKKPTMSEAEAQKIWEQYKNDPVVMAEVAKHLPSMKHGQQPVLAGAASKAVSTVLLALAALAGSAFAGNADDAFAELDARVRNSKIRSVEISDLRKINNDAKVEAKDTVQTKVQACLSDLKKLYQNKTGIDKPGAGRLTVGKVTLKANNMHQVAVLRSVADLSGLLARAAYDGEVGIPEAGKILDQAISEYQGAFK